MKNLFTALFITVIGQVVYHQKIMTGLNQLSIDKLQKGMYITMFQSKHGFVVEVEKIIKN